MKSRLLFLFLIFSPALFSQTTFGIRVGLSTTDIAPSDLIIRNSQDAEYLGIKFEESLYGLHLGIHLLHRSNKFYFMPEVIFNSQTYEYMIQDLQDSNVKNQVAKEKFSYIDVSVMGGLRLAFLRIGAGPVAHFYMDKITDLDDYQGYEHSKDPFSLGYRIGAGIDLFDHLHLDVQYEGNFSSSHRTFEFYGVEHEFDDSPSRMIATFGFSF